MHNVRENKSPCYTCPLTQNNISSCNVKSCMWNSQHYNYNCALTDNNISEYDLGESKGYSLQAVNKEVRKGKAEIKRLLVLDNYINYVKKLEMQFKIRGKIFVKQTFKTTVCNNKVFNISYKEFASCCIETLFEKFKKDNPDLNNIKLGYLLGVRENKLRVIQNSIRVKT